MASRGRPNHPLQQTAGACSFSIRVAQRAPAATELDRSAAEARKQLSRLLVSYANMLEASVQTPKLFPGPRPAPTEAERRLRVIALLRALNPNEAAALLLDKQLPDRLAALAVEVGLSAEECSGVLVGAAWKLTEGLRPLPDSPRASAEPHAAADRGLISE